MKYQWATPDLHKVAFTTTSQLTDEDPGGTGEALYIYTDSPDPEGEADNLEFIHRNALVTVNGISEDGNSGFFYSEDNAAKGALFHWDGGGADEVTHVQTDNDARMNLSFPLTCTASTPGPGSPRTAAPSPSSREKLTESDLGVSNPSNGFLFPALYVYDTDTDELACASCPPSGEATSGETWTFPGAPEDGGAAFAFGRNTFLTSDGRRLFFSSPDPLVPETPTGAMTPMSTRWGRERPTCSPPGTRRATAGS